MMAKNKAAIEKKGNQGRYKSRKCSGNVWIHMRTQEGLNPKVQSIHHRKNKSEAHPTSGIGIPENKPAGQTETNDHSRQAPDQCGKGILNTKPKTQGKHGIGCKGIHDTNQSKANHL